MSCVFGVCFRVLFWGSVRGGVLAYSHSPSECSDTPPLFLWLWSFMASLPVLTLPGRSRLGAPKCTFRCVQVSPSNLRLCGLPTVAAFEFWERTLFR